MLKILVVEDEDKLRRSLTKGLAECGYGVVAVSDGIEALKQAFDDSFDCIVLDMMLPECDGLEVVKQLRAAGHRTPVIMLTARGALEDRVLGLDSGADDYLSKPFAWEELLARIRACIRRNENVNLTMLQFDDLSLDCARRALSSGDLQLELTIRECDLMEYLIRRCGRDISREELAEEVWGEPLAGLTNIIDVYISYLRKKLGQLSDKTVIRTVRGVGYRLESER